MCFDTTDETDFVALKWIAEDISLNEVPKIIEDCGTVKFYWPPWRNPVSESKAGRICQDAEMGWPISD